ncbi:MAG: gas vesicle protein GvpD P-loop domain-containing protein [Thermoplasmata archaeon]
MSVVVRIPSELEAFIQPPHAQTLVIRGPPGSGKTMLALALLESFHGRRVYVSLRVTRGSLLRQIPWLGMLSPEGIEVVDASEETGHVQDRGRLNIKDNLLSHRDEARELDEFLWLPQAVQSAWSKTDAKNPTLVILDSWDAIIDQYFERVVGPGEPVPSRSEIERILLRRMTKGNISLVLVLERDGPAALDYQVDGIAETSRHLKEGRLERWLSIQKLRGVKVSVDTYPFTITGGRFAAITPAGLGAFDRIHPPAPDPRPEDPGMWPGSTDYAEAFGRLLPDALTLFSLDTAVPREVCRAIIGPMVIQTIQAGGRTLVLAPASLEPEDSYMSIADTLPKDAVRSRLRVMSALPQHYRAEEMPESIIPFDRIRWTKAGPSVPIFEDSEFLQAAPLTSDRPNLILVYLSGLEAMVEEAGLPVAHGILPAIAETIFPRSPVHVITVGRSNDPVLPTVSPLCRNLFDIDYTNGRVFLSGRRPYVSPRILSDIGGTEPYRLTRIE